MPSEVTCHLQLVTCDECLLLSVLVAVLIAVGEDILDGLTSLLRAFLGLFGAALDRVAGFLGTAFDRVAGFLSTSFGGIGQMLIGMTSWIFLMRILAGMGSEAVAGATITIRIMMFTTMPAWGLSNAAATLVGQNLGAQHPDRAEASVWRIGAYNMVYLLVVSIVFFALPRQLMGIFSTDPAVIRIGAEWLRILSYSFFVYGWWMVSVQAFNGAGDTATPTKINAVFFWLIQIPLSWLLAIGLDWRHSGVFWGVFISETSVGLFTLWLFTRGRWKTAQV